MDEKEEKLLNDLKQLISNFGGKAGLACTNLTTKTEININSEESFPTASSIKVPILVELYRQSDDGCIDLDSTITNTSGNKTLGSGVLVNLSDHLEMTIRDAAILMIIISDNTATNLCIDVIGREAVNATMVKLGLTQTELRGKIIWDQILDGNENLGVSTPQDLMRLLIMIEKQEILTSGACDEILSILKKTQTSDRIKRFLPINPFDRIEGREPKLTVAHKTGALKGVRNDHGIIYATKCTYVLSMMTKDCPDHRWTPENAATMLIAKTSSMVFDRWIGSI